MSSLDRTDIALAGVPAASHEPHAGPAVAAALPAASCRVLVAEDDPRLGPRVAAGLDRIGCSSRWVSDGRAALASARGQPYGLLLLATRLPAVDGLQVYRQLRGERITTPVVMMVAGRSELAAVLGLEPMAEDCLVKPFNTLELLARVMCVLRRSSRSFDEPTRVAAEAKPIEIGDLCIDAHRRRALVRGVAVELTCREFNLLLYLARSPGRVFTRAQLLDRIWGFAREVHEHTVDSHINRLRAKIERDPAVPRCIETVWGTGYRFAERGPT